MKGLPLSETHEKSEDGQVYVLKEKYAIPYRESVKAQLDSWLAGKPVHNNYADECCPDFSCCHPECLWPEEKRKRFAEAHETARNAMLTEALTGIASTDVHVAGTIRDEFFVH